MRGRWVVDGQLAVRVLECEVVQGGEDKVGSCLGLRRVEQEVDERVVMVGLRTESGVERMACFVLG